MAGLLSDSEGNLWGSAWDGGSGGGGTVFKINKESGNVENAVEFAARFTPGKGAHPTGPLAFDPAGFIWGATRHGGAQDVGTIFKVDISTNSVSTVFEFTSHNSTSNWLGPSSGLIDGGDGNLWGTTMTGGSAGSGTVFKINTTTGILSTMHEFDGTGNFSPIGSLTLDGYGFVWGLTWDGVPGFSKVFKIHIATEEFTWIGIVPAAEDGLESDGNGFLWGVATNTYNDGTGQTYRNIFKIDASTGQITYPTTTSDFGTGTGPSSKLVNDGIGFLWGSTVSGGAHDSGTIFKLNIVTGQGETVADLPKFGASAGYGPLRSPLFFHRDGYVYGTTHQHAPPNGGGTIFRFSRRNPIVFIPGIAGSVLTGNGETGVNGNGEYLWPTIGAQDIRALNPLGSVTDVSAVGIVLEYDPVDLGLQRKIVYGPLIKYLTETLGYKEFPLAERPERITNNFMLEQDWETKPSLFTFPYDWRLTNASHIETLHAYIENISALHGGTKVDVIAHSMGGLLMRQYMLAKGSAKIGKVVTIGTPFWGAPKAVYRLLTGEFYDSAVDWDTSRDMKTTLRAMPSSAELLPPFRIGHISGMAQLLSEEQWDLNGENGSSGSYSPDEFWRYMKGLCSPLDPSAINAALHTAAQDDWSGDTEDVSYLHIVGKVTVDGKPTTTSEVVAYEKAWTILGVTIHSALDFREIPVIGDNVVPLESAARSSQFLAPNAAVEPVEIDNDDADENSAEHTNLTKNADVHAKIAAFLGHSPAAAPSAARQTRAISRSPASPRRTVKLFGSSYARITNGAGDENTRLSEIAIKKVPGLKIRYGGEQPWMEISGDAAMEFTVSNPAEAREIEAEVVVNGGAGQPVSVKRYRFAPSNQSWRLSVPATEPKLEVDLDRNGTFEQAEEVAPSHQADGAVDLAPPAIDFTVAAAGGSTLATLTASDETTALPRIRYSVDGSPVQDYSSALVFEGTTPKVLRAFAEDAMGNTSRLLTVSLPPRWQGKYSGLIAAQEPGHATSGSVFMTVQVNRRIQVKGIFAGKPFSVSGTVDVSGKFTSKPINPAGHRVKLSFDLLSAAGHVTGTVVDGANVAVAEITADQTPAFAKKTPSPYAGNYTVAFPPDPAHPEAEYPQGTGSATLSVAATGAAKLVGVLGDGRPFSCGGKITSKGQFAVYSALYGKAGFVSGWVSLSGPTTNDSVTATLNWSKPVTRNPDWYPAAFAGKTVVEGSGYQSPPLRPSILDLPNGGTFTVTGGNVGTVSPVTATIDAKNKVAFTPNPGNALKLKFAPVSKGRVVGEFPISTSGKAKSVTFKGVVLQKANRAVGGFKGNGETGTVELKP